MSCTCCFKPFFLWTAYFFGITSEEEQILDTCFSLTGLKCGNPLKTLSVLRQENDDILSANCQPDKMLSDAGDKCYLLLTSITVTIGLLQDEAGPDFLRSHALPWRSEWWKDILWLWWGQILLLWYSVIEHNRDIQCVNISSTAIFHYNELWYNDM